MKQNRQQAWFAAALTRELPALRRYAAGLTGSLSLADDLVQDCLERALRRQESLAHAERLGGWLRAILHNVHIDALRRGRGMGSQVDLTEMENTLALSAPPTDREETRDFARALHSLPVEQRQILLLVGAEGLSYREISNELGIPIGTVMSRLSRARAALREKLDGGHARPSSASVGAS